jgi:hypothetical protein
MVTEQRSLSSAFLVRLWATQLRDGSTQHSVQWAMPTATVSATAVVGAGGLFEVHLLLVLYTRGVLLTTIATKVWSLLRT